MLTVCLPEDGRWQHWHRQGVTQMKTMYLTRREAILLSFRCPHLHLILSYAWMIGKPTKPNPPFPQSQHKGIETQTGRQNNSHICKYLSRRVYCRCTEKELVLIHEVRSGRWNASYSPHPSICLFTMLHVFVHQNIPEKGEEVKEGECSLFRFFPIYTVVTLKYSRLGLKNPFCVGTFCTSISRDGALGLGEGAVGLRQYRKRVQHLISIGRWNISLLRHTVVQWREWCVQTLSLATVLGPVKLSDQTHMHTQNTQCRMHSATLTDLVPQRA